MISNKPLFGIRRKTLVYLCLIIGTPFITSSCKRTEALRFDHTAQDRVLNMIEQCDQTLLSSDNGWQMDMTTDTGAKFRLQMQFMPNKHVKIYGDFVAVPKESTYRYNAEEGPVLSFDSYGVIHDLADPTVRPYESDHQGNGYKGDFEFIIQKVTKDSIYLQGVKYGKSYVMGRLQSAPSVSSSKEIPLFVERTNSGALFKTLDQNGQPFADLKIDPIGRYVSSTFDNQVPITIIRPMADGRVSQDRVKAELTTDGFVLNPALSLDNQKIEHFVWDQEHERYTCSENPAITLNNNSNSPAVIPTIDLQSFYYGDVNYGLVSKNLRPLLDGIHQEIIDVVALQLYAHFKLKNGREINSISFFCNNGHDRNWKNFYCMMEPVDPARNIYRIIPSNHPVSKSRTPDLYAAMADSKSATYQFINLFTTLTDPDNTIMVYPVGPDKMAFVRTKDSRSYFILGSK